MCVVCCQVEVSATDSSVGVLTDFGVSECDLKASKVSRPWPTRVFAL